MNTNNIRTEEFPVYADKGNPLIPDSNTEVIDINTFKTLGLIASDDANDPIFLNYKIIRLERSLLARGADYVGYIPFIGTITGVIRLVANFFIATCLKIATPKNTNEDFLGTRNFKIAYAKDEMIRGIFECFSFFFLPIVMEFCFNKVDYFARGQYIYYVKERPDAIVYTKEPYEAKSMEVNL